MTTKIEIGFKTNGKKNGLCKVFEGKSTEEKYLYYQNGKKMKDIPINEVQNFDLCDYLNEDQRDFVVFFRCDKENLENNIKQKLQDKYYFL